MQLSNEFIKELDIEYLRLLTDCLKKGEIGYDEAKKSAQEYLQLQPFSTIEDLQRKIVEYCKKFPSLNGLNVFILQKLEHSKTNDVLEKMRNLMKDNKIDDALKLAQS